MTNQPERYRCNPVAFIDKFVTRNEKGKPWSLRPYQRRVLQLAFASGIPGILLWGEPKKLEAALVLWWGYTRAYTEVIVAANDLEQSQGRVFQTGCALIKHNPALLKSAKVKQSSIELSNGTTVTAIPNDYKGEAGSRHSLVCYDELWGYSSEASLRLFEELTPPPTEEDAWILIGTYAGFTGEACCWSGSSTAECLASASMTSSRCTAKATFQCSGRIRRANSGRRDSSSAWIAA